MIVKKTSPNLEISSQVLCCLWSYVEETHKNGGRAVSQGEAFGYVLYTWRDASSGLRVIRVYTIKIVFSQM